MITRKALELAEEKGLDLVKISPNAKPPVCKLMDYDKAPYMSRPSGSASSARISGLSNSRKCSLSATIEENDVLTKAKMARRFLEDGDKVKVSIRFPWPPDYPLGHCMRVMQDFAERVKDVSSVERKPLLDGRHMIMILAPKAEKSVLRGKRKPARPAKPVGKKPLRRRNKTAIGRREPPCLSKSPIVVLQSVFSFTKTGIVKHKQMNANHQVRLKTTKRTRHLRANGVIDNNAEARTIHKLLPYK